MALVLCLTMLLVRPHFAAGLPYTEPTNSSTVTVGWVSDAPRRGTLSIITSCVLTMGLCVWSALHLNIPSREQSQVQFWLRNARWMLVGIFGPELVVYTAWKQYASARSLQDRIQGHSSSRNKDEATTSGLAELPSSSDFMPLCDRSHWSIVHGFYAGMGGFVFDLDSTSASTLLPSESQPRRLTLTPRGIALLADCGLLPDITIKDIRDKSKADGVAKSIVCLQAGWMVIQVIGRVAYKLPVTMLEINTIGHVICAFVIYLLWWHKPRLIKEPTIIRGDWVMAVCAYMWMSSGMSDPKGKSKLPLFGRRAAPEFAKLAFYSDRAVKGVRAVSHPETTPKSKERNGKTEDAGVVVNTTEYEDCAPWASSPFAYKKSFGYLGRVTVHKPHKSTTGATETRLPNSSQLHLQTPPDRWSMALDAMHMFPAIGSRIKFDNIDPQPQPQSHPLELDELLHDSAPNWSSDTLLSNFRGMLMGMALWLASIAFGGVHAAAWNEYFPSRLECWLWRSSSVYIMASGFLWLCINFLGQISVSFNTFWDTMLAKHGNRASYIVLGSTCVICGLAYAFARTFLIVEAVICLRSLPLKAYETPNWSQLIPHL